MAVLGIKPIPGHVGGAKEKLNNANYLLTQPWYSFLEITTENKQTLNLH